MSRHKLVKALDLDEELDDFEGVDEFGYDEEVSAEDKGVNFLLIAYKNAGLGASLSSHRLTRSF